MNIFTGIKSIYSGTLKARRDYRKIVAHSEEHHERHKRFPEWECGEWNSEFFSNIRHPVDVDYAVNAIEAGAYSQESRRLQREKLGGTGSSGFRSLTVETDGTEGPEEVIAKIVRAIEGQIEFDELQLEERVSETEKKKKGGK